MPDVFKSLPFQERGVSSFRYPIEKVDVHRKSILRSLEVQEITYLLILKVFASYQRKRERKKCEYYQHLNDKNDGKNCPYVPFIGDFIVYLEQIQIFCY